MIAQEAGGSVSQLAQTWQDSNGERQAAQLVLVKVQLLQCCTLSNLLWQRFQEVALQPPSFPGTTQYSSQVIMHCQGEDAGQHLNNSMHRKSSEVHRTLRNKGQKTYMRLSCLQFPISGGMLASLLSFSHSSCQHVRDQHTSMISLSVCAGMCNEQQW